jgi:hypothetical protein
VARSADTPRVVRIWPQTIMMVIIWLAVGGVDTQAAGPEASPAVVVRDQPPGPPPPTNAAQPEPTRLRIPRLSVDVAVVPTGVDTDGQMTLPERVDYVGWYGFGPAPGVAAGSAVLAGHVDSRVYGIGPLSRLSAATRGDEVVVQRRTVQSSHIGSSRWSRCTNARSHWIGCSPGPAHRSFASSLAVGHTRPERDTATTS